MDNQETPPAEVWSDPSREVKPEFDWGREGARPFGLSELQYRLVRGLLQGKSKYQSAKDAGYGGEGASLRSTASQASKARPVDAPTIAQIDLGSLSPEQLRAVEQRMTELGM